MFALVAADLPFIEDFFITKSGKRVTLRIFTEKENIDKIDHAMNSLKASMKWDEDKYGLEYDLVRKIFFYYYFFSNLFVF